MIDHIHKDKCIFCGIAQGKGKAWRVYEDDLVVAFFDIYPAAEAHTLIIPKSHFENIYDVEVKYLRRIIDVAKNLAILYKEKLGITDLNIIHGSGKAAQQDVFHFHIHLVPRKVGDKFQLHYDPNKEISTKFDVILKRILD